MFSNIRVRFAPSPTGDLHIGGLRVALLNWLFARQRKGIFILRIEDTDQKRYQPQSVHSIVEGMTWAGLTWEEGPYLNPETGEIEQKGGYGPYFQSQRTDLYRAHIEILLKNGWAYRCFCTPERLDDMRKRQERLHLPPMYDKKCRTLNNDEIGARLANGESHVVRLKVPAEGGVEVEDLIRGTVRFDLRQVDDQVLLKSDGYPTYHLANVVDDHAMAISHVLRGEDWISSLPKHILLYRAFSWEAPQFGHLPLILAPDKTRLSKRHGAVSVLAFRELGYLAEALLNFTLLLGWNPGKGSEQEIFSKDAMTEKFTLEGVQKSPAIFNYEKLNWMNGQYIKNMEIKKLMPYVLPNLLKSGALVSLGEHAWTTAQGMTVDERYLHEALALARPRLMLLNDDWVKELDYLFAVPEFKVDMLAGKKGSRGSALHALRDVLAYIMTLDEKMWELSDKVQALESCVKQWIVEKKYTNGEILWPLRVALTGREQSPSPFEVMAVLGKDESRARVEQAINILE